MQEKPSSLVRRIGEIVAAVSVVSSLVFVGLEVHQNTLAVRGATYQALSDAASGALLELAHDPQLAALMARVFNEDAVSEDFTGPENMQLTVSHMAFIRRLENSYLQYREGILDERVFEGYGWNDGVLRTHYFREFWFRGAGATTGQDFIEFFERRTGITPPPPR